ncbi:PD-(D/E)XK nuclease family protein [Halomicrococcus sp. NG-SE-24]|uniref:CRISPR-associated protein Cas4 n=1 Tax=Halomicrococcus sp. NG-SE-24 TaxID=3436928 RepID=UPI003D981031
MTIDLPDSEENKDDLVGTLVDKIGPKSFEQWNREREFKQNVQSGRAYLNTPPPNKPARQHNPSQLNQCHRKIYYRQLNAPEETEDPEGIFWTGTKFEEEVMMPYLSSIVDGVAYIQNSIWVEFTVETDQGEVEFRGKTDPVVVDAESSPILPTEIKTKQSIGSLEEPNAHHLAQTYAYMYGLSQAWETEITDALIIYGDRTSLDIRPFHVQFDEDYWWDNVVAWAADHTGFRTDDRLPPADPVFGWECRYCSFKTRCGETKKQFSDIDAVGFLPLFGEYPREKVINYLHSHEGAKLTPTLANQYPELVGKYGSYRWRCPGCDGRFPIDVIEWTGDVSNLPDCPKCSDTGVSVALSGPDPDDQTPDETPRGD